jgi:hypothetical protein
MSSQNDDKLAAKQVHGTEIGAESGDALTTSSSISRIDEDTIKVDLERIKDRIFGNRDAIFSTKFMQILLVPDVREVISNFIDSLEDVIILDNLKKSAEDSRLSLQEELAFELCTEYGKFFSKTSDKYGSEIETNLAMYDEYTALTQAAQRVVEIIVEENNASQAYKDFIDPGMIIRRRDSLKPSLPPPPPSNPNLPAVRPENENNSTSDGSDLDNKTLTSAQASSVNISDCPPELVENAYKILEKIAYSVFEEKIANGTIKRTSLEDQIKIVIDEILTEVENRVRESYEMLGKNKISHQALNSPKTREQFLQRISAFINTNIINFLTVIPTYNGEEYVPATGSNQPPESGEAHRVPKAKAPEVPEEPAAANIPVRLVDRAKHLGVSKTQSLLGDVLTEEVDIDEHLDGAFDNLLSGQPTPELEIDGTHNIVHVEEEGDEATAEPAARPSMSSIPDGDRPTSIYEPEQATALRADSRLSREIAPAEPSTLSGLQPPEPLAEILDEDGGDEDKTVVTTGAPIDFQGVLDEAVKIAQSIPPAAADQPVVDTYSRMQELVGTADSKRGFQIGQPSQTATSETDTPANSVEQPALPQFQLIPEIEPDEDLDVVPANQNGQAPGVASEPQTEVERPLPSFADPDQQIPAEPTSAEPASAEQSPVTAIPSTSSSPLTATLLDHIQNSQKPGSRSGSGFPTTSRAQRRGRRQNTIPGIPGQGGVLPSVTGSPVRTILGMGLPAESQQPVRPDPIRQLQDSTPAPSIELPKLTATIKFPAPSVPPAERSKPPAPPVRGAGRTQVIPPPQAPIFAQQPRLAVTQVLAASAPDDGAPSLRDLRQLVEQQVASQPTGQMAPQTGEQTPPGEIHVADLDDMRRTATERPQLYQPGPSDKKEKNSLVGAIRMGLIAAGIGIVGILGITATAQRCDSTDKGKDKAAQVDVKKASNTASAVPQFGQKTPAEKTAEETETETQAPEAVTTEMNVEQVKAWAKLKAPKLYELLNKPLALKGGYELGALLLEAALDGASKEETAEIAKLVHKFNKGSSWDTQISIGAGNPSDKIPSMLEPGSYLSQLAIMYPDIANKNLDENKLAQSGTSKQQLEYFKKFREECKAQGVSNVHNVTFVPKEYNRGFRTNVTRLTDDQQLARIEGLHAEKLTWVQDMIKVRLPGAFKTASNDKPVTPEIQNSQPDNTIGSLFGQEQQFSQSHNNIEAAVLAVIDAAENQPAFTPTASENVGKASRSIAIENLKENRTEALVRFGKLYIPSATTGQLIESPKTAIYESLSALCKTDEAKVQLKAAVAKLKMSEYDLYEALPEGGLMLRLSANQHQPIMNIIEQSQVDDGWNRLYEEIQTVSLKKNRTETLIREGKLYIPSATTGELVESPKQVILDCYTSQCKTADAKVKIAREVKALKMSEFVRYEARAEGGLDVEMSAAQSARFNNILEEDKFDAEWETTVQNTEFSTNFTLNRVKHSKAA